MLVLVLLAIVWVVALTPMVLRKLREREVVSSVTSFHRHLSHLSWGASRSHGDTAPLPGAATGFSAAAKHLSGGSIAAQSTPGPSGSSPIGPLVSRATTIRRRRVVTTLAAATIVSFLLSIGVSTFLYLAVGCLVASLTYLGLLAYFHQLAMERAQKVVALETRREMALALDEARHHCGQLAATSSGARMAGTGWSVQQNNRRAQELVSAGR